MVELSDVTAGYGGREVLRSVSVCLRAGELVTLIGANGAGKSTLLKVMSGDLPVCFFGRLGADDRMIVNAALADTGMGAFARRYVSSLSDGERQKVMIARVLAQQTDVVFLDEPTAFLDVASRVEVLALLRKLARKHNKAILLSSHDIASALGLSDRVWLLPGDGTLRDDTPSALIAAHDAGVAGNALDALFAGREVVFDSRRLDYVGKS